jgi:death-on-curing protein
VKAPRWIAAEVILAIHEEQLAEHGGLAGVRDEGALDAALARPVQKFAYEPESDTALLAAAYAFGLARNHPFADGNKRTAFVAMELFLALNGFVLEASDEDCIMTMLALAAGELDEAALAAWIRAHSRPG